MTDERNDEIKYNESGFGFRVDRDLTDWLTGDRHVWGGFSKGADKKYVVLNVYDIKGEHVQNLLFDTSTQEPLMELGLDLDTVGCKLDFIKLKLQKDDETK